jgi:predicted ABC-type ATPase
MRPKMIVVAGPPGSGKSVAFPVDSFGVDSFNADDRSAQLNNGSYQGIPLEIRAIVNKEFEAFVEDHIRNHKSFAIETTLRSDITFRQAGQARAEGFEIQMRYIALNGFAQNLKRVIARAFAGGHSAPADQLQKIHEASLRNLPKAIREMDRIQVYDNSAPDRRPKRVLSAQSGKVTYLHPSPPEWLEVVLAGSEFQIHE